MNNFCVEIRVGCIFPFTSHNEIPTFAKCKFLFKFQTKSFITCYVQEIRRHLRQKRPQDTTSYDVSLEDADEDDDTDGVDEEGGGGEEEEEEEEGEGLREEVNVVDEDGIIENSEVTSIRKVQHGQEIGVETVTESKNMEEEVKQIENQTKHLHDHQRHRNHLKGEHHSGKKKAREHAVTIVSTEESVRQNRPGEKKFDDYDSEGSQVSTLVTTENSRFHHRHHHFSPTSVPHINYPANLTTDQPAHVDSAIEVTLDYLDFNVTEGPTTENSVILNLTASKPTSQQRVKLPKPTASNENKVS
jgi:hypothetical protein